MKNKLNLLVILALIIGIGLACGGGNQQEEANKVVDEANKKLEEAKELMAKTDARSTTLFSVPVQTVAQLNDYKAKMKGEAKSIADDYEKVSNMLKDVSKKFDDISRMNLVDKYKEYAKIKADEFAKRSEAINIHKGNAQAFVEISEPKEMFSKFNENNKKSDSLMKEADDLSSKAKKIEEENKDIFRKL
ncbi:MAG: hypothetical protein K1X72_03460 [Pyrinomonadaceae bacterium]|nr:hypothetical protein [Pyrinomonadaceae bacterium]